MSVKIVALALFGAALIAVTASSSRKNEHLANHVRKPKGHANGFLEEATNASQNLSEGDKETFNGMISEYVDLRKTVLGEIAEARKNFTTKLAKAKQAGGWEKIVEFKQNEGATLRQKSDEGYGKLHESEQKIWKLLNESSNSTMKN